MKIRIAPIIAAFLLGASHAFSQTPPAYSPPDLILTFEDAAGTDVEFNLGPATSLPASGTEDFGNVSSCLTANGQTLASTDWSVAAGFTGEINGGAGTTVNTALGTLTVLPNAIWLTQANGAQPSFVGSASANSTPVNDAIESVGTDISLQTNTVGTAGIGLLGVAVSAAGDPNSYTSQGSFSNVSTDLETSGHGSAALWLLTSTTPGTSGKSGTDEGPFNGAYDLGVFSVSASGELTFASAASQQAPGNNPVGSRLLNISSRASVGTGANVEIAGFVISGPTGSTEQVLVRAGGPSLSQFGVSGVLAQPVLALFDSSGGQIATNTGWGTASNATQIMTAAEATGAFAYSTGSDDSAVLLNLAPGAYTAQVSGANGSTGVALAEVYEVSDGGADLINISTRAYVGIGSSVEIGGFVIRGPQPMNVLVRAVGPTLSQFGVAGVLAVPSLNVVDSLGNSVASNTGWSTNADPAMIASETATVGAFALPSGSADCALFLTLPPGAYTAIVSGVGGSSGVALVEMYKAP
jgi:hypothetical protein